MAFSPIVKGQVFESARNSELTFNSIDGYRLHPVGKYRFLTIMVNIIYPDTDKDPYPGRNRVWDPAYKEGINNESIPVYLEDLLDIEYDPDNVNGMMTRLYHESSFGNLIILGDFIVVNIKLETLNPQGGGFHIANSEIIDNIFELINKNGGLDNTLYGYNSIDDYDNNNDGKIDNVMFLWRNTTGRYGRSTWGRGVSMSNLNFNILAGGKLNKQESVNYTAQGVSNRKVIPLQLNGIVMHEVSHHFFGANNLHSSGGNHYSGGRTNTWFGLEGGYGLMGGYNSGLVSCNGYERWRMNWTSPKHNPEGYPIQASRKPSDISREDGEKSFLLRDFVTTGDVVRIKLPYVDSGASNQYIWLENHQIGNNNKLDYLEYSIGYDGKPWHECRPKGTPGIYSYIQVGKDILEGTEKEVYPWNETDNLRIISAEGNWDFMKMENHEVNCVRSGYQHTAKRYMPNPLSGYQDQTTHFFDNTPDNEMLSSDDGHWLNIKYNSNGKKVLNKALPYLGDESDAFTDSGQMNIGTNPPPANQKTSYTYQQGGNFKLPDSLDKRGNYKYYQNTNTSNIYLTGLRIDMTEKPGGKFKIDIVWNDYNVRNDVRWTGSIIMKEKIILKEGKTIKIDQSKTPNQIFRDSVSGLFAKPSIFTCKDGSEFIMEDNSNLILNNNSTLLLKSGSTFKIGDNASLTINKGNKLIIKPGAELIKDKNSRLKIKKGGKLIK